MLAGMDETKPVETGVAVGPEGPVLASGEAMAGEKPKGKRKGPSGRYVPLGRFKEVSEKLAAYERAAEFQDDGEITAAKMKKVLGQEACLDRGPTEAILRGWLNEGVSKYEARMRQLVEEESGAAARERELQDLKAEVAELRKAASPAGVDAGAARARDVIGKILGSKVSR